MSETGIYIGLAALSVSLAINFLGLGLCSAINKAKAEIIAAVRERKE